MTIGMSDCVLVVDRLFGSPTERQTSSKVPPLTYLVTAKPACLRFHSSAAAHASHPIKREKVIIATLRSQS